MQDAEGATGKDYNNNQREHGLEHHEHFGTMGQGQGVGRTEGGGRGEGEKEEIEITGLPVCEFGGGKTVLGEQKVGRTRNWRAQLERVGVHYPVPQGKDENVNEGDGDGVAYETDGVARGVARQADDEKQDTRQEFKGEK